VKLIVAQLFKKCLAFYGTGRLIAVDLSPASGTCPELDEYISHPHSLCFFGKMVKVKLSL
jgi:hypothetical protein